MYRLIWFQHIHKAAGTLVVNLAKANGEVLYPNNANGNPLDEEGNRIELWNLNGQELLSFVDKCERLGVTFVATANIGNEYTSTRVMDKALMDRFTIVEMDVLNDVEEHGLLEYMFPHVDSKVLKDVATIAHMTRVEANNETARISSGISTRTSVEMAGLLYDGFGLEESANVCVYPQYDSTGGVDSERTFVKQIVQKFCDDGSSDDLFNEDEMATAEEDTY